MKVDVSNIVKTDGASLDLDYCNIPEGLSDMEEGQVFDTPVSFNGKIVNVSGVLKLEGILKASYKVKCFRCLKEIAVDLNVDVLEDFVSSATDNQDGVYVYENNMILLEKVLADNIILNLPMKQLCNLNCLGICPECGKDLNENSCECKKEELNPQMEVLKKFFENN